jgi:hypothetical protein
MPRRPPGRLRHAPGSAADRHADKKARCCQFYIYIDFDIDWRHLRYIDFDT